MAESRLRSLWVHLDYDGSGFLTTGAPTAWCMVHGGAWCAWCVVRVVRRGDT